VLCDIFARREVSIVFRRLIAGLLIVPATAVAQTSAVSSAAPLRVVAVDVQPTVAAPDTLCRLKARIRNDGSEPASELTFQVTVNGQRLAPYLNHTFLNRLEPGKETEVPLYNFWSSEAGRPFPKDGRLVIAVQLTGARWVGTRGGTARDVKPLPSALSVTVLPRRSS
jgi:hypothetical protein